MKSIEGRIMEGNDTMADSSSFSSLTALAFSHLSKTSIQNSSEGVSGFPRRIPIPSLNGIRTGTLSDTQLAPDRLPKLPLPPFSLSESPIKNVLEEQISNMLKAQAEKKRIEEEKIRITEEMKKLTVEEDCMIDLTAALEDAAQFRSQYRQHPPKEELSSSSSMESLFESNFINCDVELKQTPAPEPLLPCITDMSFILKQKIKRGKCSPFGKVLTSRLRPVAAPYLHEKIETTIIPFDFKTKSPDDINKEKQHWKPSMSARCTFDVTTFLL